MKKIVYMLVLLIAGAGCSVPKVTFDYDKSINFQQFKTYNYFPDMVTGMNELDDKRIVYQLDSTLKSKGLSKSDNPELYVNIKVTRFQGQSPFSLNVGIGSVGRSGGVGVSGGAPVGTAMFHEEILFDVVHAKRNELIWQARSEKRVRDETTPLKREQYFAEIVTKVFQNFPPKN
jgi:hypothetical protein